jgi:hypothetical protein
MSRDFFLDFARKDLTLPPGCGTLLGVVTVLEMRKRQMLEYTSRTTDKPLVHVSH